MRWPRWLIRPTVIRLGWPAQSLHAAMRERTAAGFDGVSVPTACRMTGRTGWPGADAFRRGR
ncbi:hypothetical protein DF107_13285 [Burkholderia stagnalis]|uniref:Uncharacterized protein n=1 Tax=Burkholderia stagnalis TaxID=1503054 RepID=A0ABX9YLI5_9BURK|nr:hypothetical protein WT74_25450 [Burkholderia stagnalis]KVC57749.1 hypothetical protein WS59_03900 [Burkholderia stagnalis]KVL94045.1 hypothetical protein WT03_16640 [Burkholderia stagnalis]KVM01282.1 hypothetical protein WT02_06185 [Burkholderia stagnalis]KVM02468.1 hypothetical protein WT04_32400 [Burkholderia stagnalis]